MADLYDNLENYHDDKIIDELKNENNELKSKLEEYSNAMARLQNDFDKLNSEYKKLEINYSSLLKTARAEVERKSDMIKSLNSEKDLLVIKSLQSTGTNILKTRRHNLNDTQKSSNKNGIDSEWADDPQQKKDQSLQSNIVGKSLRNHRVNSTQPQSEGTLSSMENHSNFSEDSRKANNYPSNILLKTKLNDTKDIYSEDVKYSNSREHTNFNSQKFMRMNRVEQIYSSDDDLEEFNFKNIRKSSTEDTSYKSNYNRGKYFSPSRELYKNSSHQFMDHDKYRHTRYESGRNYRRHSPQNYKDDYRKEKKLRIPSPDKYSSKCRDRRFISEREKYFNNPRHQSHYGNSVVKHKIRNDHVDSSSKRQKLEENTTTSDKNMYSKEQENVYLNKHNLTEISSCQSPDYENVDNTVPIQVMKEIKDTATTLLDDLRVSSQKTALKKEKEKKVLSAVDCQNIDKKPINVSTCDMRPRKMVTLPEPINRNELSMVPNKDLVSETNINIDKRTFNSQLDSENIQRDIDNYCNLQADIKICGKINNKKKDDSDTIHNLKETDSNKLQKHVPDTNKYKIPKLDQKSDTVSNDMKYDCEKSSNKYECNIDKKGKCSKTTSTAQTESSNIKKVSEDNKKIEMIQKTCKKLIPEKTALALSTLADDLELSDEANENKEFQKVVPVPLACTKRSKKISNNDKAFAVSVDSNESQSYLPLVKDNYTEPKEISDVVNSKKETRKEFHQENNKTSKIKKKSAQKEISIKPNEQNKQLHTFSESKEQEHKHFVSIQTKNKFSDLFGDSSSLITPDDLGIPSHEILPLDDKYASVFDNTQDAVDLNVDLHKTQCTITKINTFPIILKELSADKTVVEQTSNTLNILMSKETVKNAKETNSSVNILYNKPEPERFHSSSEVVKTLIISSGVQPNTVQYVPGNNKLQKSEINDTEFPNIIHEDKKNSKKCAMSDIQALATSTPHKYIHESVSLQISDLNGEHYSDKINEETNVSSNTNSSKQITNEADIPDLRIIVKRRRKIIKNP